MKKGRGVTAFDSGLPNTLECNFETGFGSLNECVSSSFGKLNIILSNRAQYYGLFLGEV